MEKGKYTFRAWPYFDVFLTHYTKRRFSLSLPHPFLFRYILSFPLFVSHDVPFVRHTDEQGGNNEENKSNDERLAQFLGVAAALAACGRGLQETTEA